MAENRASTKVIAPNVDAQWAPSWFHRDWLWALILMLSVISTYAPVWKAGFVWDDETILTANPCIVGPLGLKEIWTTPAADICPLTLTTFWAEHALWGLNPLPYHLANVLLHGACAILLWWVLRRLRVQGAWLGAALWALHPIAVESVAWITEMKNTESGVFFLLSILFLARCLGAKDVCGPDRSSRSYVLGLLFAALAMAAKSSTVILPVAFCSCVWWMGGRWCWRNVAKATPIFLMAIAATGLSIWTQGLQLATVTDPQLVRTWPERLTAAGNAVWFYLGKLLWPHPLVAIYPPSQIFAGRWLPYLTLPGMIVMLSIFWLRGRSGGAGSRACFFAFAYFLVALLPILGLFPTAIFRLSLVFDHLQYLASIGPLALAGAGLVLLSNSIVPKKQWLQATLCASLLFTLGMVSLRRTLVYASNQTFWTDTLVKNPDCWTGLNNLGRALLEKGQVHEALEQFQKALEINPGNVDTRNNLGNALLQRGKLDEAIAQYRKALEINPSYPEVHYNFANALVQKGEFEEAVVEFQKALEINPGYADAHYNFGNALLQKGKLDEAVVEFQKALEINPGYADARNSLGVTLVQKGRLDEGIVQFQEVLRLKPDFSLAQDNLTKAQTLARQSHGHE